MKQKRTVKSLLPRKYTLSGKFLTVLLLILSVILCLGSASLMTTSVGAAENESISDKNVYSGYDDRVEVLYRLELSNPEELYGDNPVEEFYMENGSLYVTPNKVRVENDGNVGDYTFLGGMENKVDADNITIIAGYGNGIGNSNNNVSLLGGRKNVITGYSSDFGVPAVIAGGKKNEIINNYGNAILGGSGNTINTSHNVTILGGEKNSIGSDNIIVGGKKVSVAGYRNVFAFSNEDSGFEPLTSGAFYLNLTNGVGINADSEKTGMAVGGAVGFGSVEGKTCNGSNIGVEGVLNLGGYRCLVGCTRESSNVGKWELLDRGGNCEKVCVGNCMLSSPETDLERQTYIGRCTEIKPESAKWCIDNEWESYENVVFQTIRVNSLDECANVGDNKCAYYCEGDDSECEIDDNPEEDDGQYSCIGTQPKDDNAEFVEGSDEGLKRNWNRKIYNRGEETGKKCAYRCQVSHHLEDGKCVPDLMQCKQEGGPENSHYIANFVYGSEENCKWECNGGYSQSGNACVLNKCVGDAPEHAYFVTGSDEGLTVDTQKQVIKYSQKDDGIRCAYLCESGFVAVLKNFGGGNYGYVCDQCELGTQDPNNPDVCVKVEDCPDGYVRDSSKGTGCYLKGVCRYKNGDEYTGLSLGGIIGKTGDILPVTSQDFKLKCIDGDKYKGEVEPNTCAYKCKSGYYCNGLKCEKPQCRSRTDFGKDDDGKYYYYSTGIAGHYDFHRGYTMIFVSGSNITTPEEFYTEYRNKSGCYYWCPPENHFYVANSVFLWRCGSLSTVEANQKKCGTIYLYGYGVSVKKPKINKQAWEYTGNYQAVKDGVLSCTRSCEPGSQVMFATRMTENNAKDIEKYGYPHRLFVTGSSGKICYKECKKDGKYMKDDGKCYSCPVGYKLDENQLGTSVIDGVTYQEYRGCTPDCPDGTVWQNNACMQKEIGGICPEGYVSEGGNCYKCLSASQTYVPGKGCIDNA